MHALLLRSLHITCLALHLADIALMRQIIPCAVWIITACLKACMRLGKAHYGHMFMICDFRI
jgi:hypothetical protein